MGLARPQQQRQQQQQQHHRHHHHSHHSHQHGSGSAGLLGEPSAANSCGAQQLSAWREEEEWGPEGGQLRASGSCLDGGGRCTDSRQFVVESFLVGGCTRHAGAIMLALAHVAGPMLRSSARLLVCAPQTLILRLNRVLANFLVLDLGTHERHATGATAGGQRAANMCRRRWLGARGQQRQLPGRRLAAGAQRHMARGHANAAAWARSTRRCAVASVSTTTAAAWGGRLLAAPTATHAAVAARPARRGAATRREPTQLVHTRCGAGTGAVGVCE
jgi:hypothetical protein